MSRQSARYPLGRAFPTFFISFFLGGVWGATAAAVFGMIVFGLHTIFGFHVGEVCWHFLTGSTLVLSLYLVQKVAGRTPPGADEDEAKRVQTDRALSVCSFAAAYILVWLLMWGVFYYPTIPGVL